MFAEPGQSPDPFAFGTQHPSDDAVYAQVAELLETQVVPFPPSRAADDAVFGLADAYGARGADVAAAIKTAGRIVFHAVGDVGSSDVHKYRNELRVADQLSIDCVTDEAGNRPALLFHPSDVVYNFGKSCYYYDQFYEPYRAYPAPVFAVAGKHDSFIIPGTPHGEEPLTTFARNFCSPQPVIALEAGSLHRTAMTQPGDYFALAAPFVRIIELFGNAFEDPGLISDEGGKWPGVPDAQLKFLATQLRRIKQESYQGAVLVAVHRPPFNYTPPPASGARGGNHGRSSDMLRDMDRVFLTEGVYLHAFLSAHAHNYQRYMRTIRFDGTDRDGPFVVCGNGGHNVNPIVRSGRSQPAPGPENGSRVDHLETEPAVETSGLVLEEYDDHDYGYLRISVEAQ